MQYAIFLPVFGLLGVFILLQAIEMTKLKQRIEKLEMLQNDKNKKG